MNEPLHIKFLDQSPHTLAQQLLAFIAAAGDRSGMEAVFAFAQRTPAWDSHLLAISAQDVQAVAAAYAHKGWPLTPVGLQKFAALRGLHPTLSPTVAAALVRTAAGLEAQLYLSPAILASLNEEQRMALRLLLLIGQRPAELLAVRQALGVSAHENEPASVVWVGKVFAQQLCIWLRNHQLQLTRLNDIAQRLGIPAHRWGDIAFALADAILGRSEPAHDYSRTLHEGHTLNGRTLAMLQAARQRLPNDATLRVLKGSYLREDAHGAHPHLGGGALDLELTSHFDEAVAALRHVGFAAWLRTRNDRPPHIHAIAIGDREMAPAAAWQVREYLTQHDGRSRSSPDPHAHLAGRRPGWILKY